MVKRVRTTSAYQQAIARYPEFRVVGPVIDLDLAKKVGFVALPEEGEAIVPMAVGPATAFNANGREVVRRDLPMETYSRMIFTSWEDWHGQTHTGTQLRDYQAYPRDLVPAPGEQVIAMRRGAGLVLASRVFARGAPEDQIVNVLNIFLELFGGLEIVPPNLDSDPGLTIKRVRWKILPPGDYPFDRAKEALKEYLERLPEGDKEIAKERIRAITSHGPNFIAVGLGGFSDYVVFGFTKKNRFVLESPNAGNATYIFRNGWEELSGMSKAEIIEGGHHEARLIHNHRWYNSLREAISHE